jgi:tripartite-type tricarboxylate transporter receptor subunit TctC
MRRSRFIALQFSAWATATLAQDKPPLKILVGFPPGGSADVSARAFHPARKALSSPLRDCPWWR